LKLLLDTHLLIWTAIQPARLPKAAVAIMGDPGNDLVFSAASIWEVAIKRQLRRPGFNVDPVLLRRGLLDTAYTELAVTGVHGLGMASLFLLHRDPFDRILIAQAAAEGMLLLTSDAMIARYPGPIRRV